LGSIGPFCRPVSAAKNSVPDSSFGDGFDPCVGSRQFDPDRLHHPVLRNRKSRRRLPIGRFCGDFRRYRSTLSVSGDPRGLSGRFLASSLCIQKFRSPRGVLTTGSRSAAGNFGRLGRPKARHFEPWSVFIPDLVQGPRTAGPIRLAHRATVRFRYRVAKGLRPRPARGLVRGTRARSSC
jgi:hypothetical protein